MLIKKGQSLVEVVVAVGIIGMVFAGTVTLIVQVVNLELSARNRTEAVALGQKYLSENIRDIKEGCTTNISTGTLLEPPVSDYTVVSSCSAVGEELEDVSGECDSTDFVRIKVDVSWTDRNLPEETYTASQIVRVEG